MIRAMVRSFGVAVAFVLVCVSSPAAAQSAAQWDVSGGYAMLNDPQIETFFGKGWIVGAAVPIASWISILGEASGVHSHVKGVESDARLTAHSILGGVRLSAALGRLTEFVQVVAGDARGAGSWFGVTDTRHAFALQPGLGVDIPLRRHLAARGQVDVRFITNQIDAVDADHQLRIAAALVYYRDRR